VYAASPANCDVVSRGQWDHYPVIVNAEGALISETLEAIAGFNEQVGFTMFAFEVSNSDPDVIVVADGPNMAAARAKHATIDGRHYGAVLVYNGLELRDRSDIILHELGHIVGLKHDHENRNSLMFPSTATRVATLEKQDVRALRSIYLGR
jgi:predicted Zn-dependent protease